jgi:hypothetical protein
MPLSNNLRDFSLVSKQKIAQKNSENSKKVGRLGKILEMQLKQSKSQNLVSWRANL